MSNRLPVLRATASEAHAAVGQHQHGAAERALEAGTALVEARDLCLHGTWAAWLSETGIPARSASRYMTLARSGIISAIVADLGLSRAERYAVLGGRMIPPQGRAIEAVGADIDSPVGMLILCWRTDDRLSYVQAILPDGLLLQPRGPVLPWVVGLLHDGVRERFDLYDERVIPVEEAIAFMETAP